MTGTPPGGSRTRVACSARITKPADLRTLQHAFITGALNSGALRDHTEVASQTDPGTT
jgi:hypothetical protein